MLLYSISLALLVSLVTCSFDGVTLDSGDKFSDSQIPPPNYKRSTVHINSKRSKRAVSSKLKHTRVKNSNIPKRNRIRPVTVSYIQTTTDEAIDFIPENLHLNRRQVPSEEYQSNKKLAVGICAGFFVLIFLLCTFLLVRSYRRYKNRTSLHPVEDPSNDVFPYSVQKPEPVLDSGHKVQTKWRINSFLGVVSSVVAKLPKTRSMISSVGHMSPPVNPQQRQY